MTPTAQRKPSNHAKRLNVGLCQFMAVSDINSLKNLLVDMDNGITKTALPERLRKGIHSYHKNGAIILNLGVTGNIVDIISHIKFYANWFRCFEAVTPQNLSISTRLACGSYNSVSTAMLHCDLHQSPSEFHEKSCKFRFTLNIANNQVCVNVILKKKCSACIIMYFRNHPKIPRIH